jgi:hypothetical protein
MNQTIKLNLTDEQRAELKSEFGKLETIDEKLDFWNEKLKIDFCYFDRCEMYDIQDFWIRTNNENEVEFINSRNLNKFKERIQPFQGKNGFPDFEQRKQAFLIAIEKVPNKDSYINDELRKLDHLINEKEKGNNQANMFQSRFFTGTYIRYMETGIPPVWNNSINETGNLVEAEKGLIIARYKQFLEEYKSPKKPETKKTYTHAVQILILDYLDFYKSLDNAKKAKLYSPVINRDAETTRQMFSNLNDYKTTKNLDLILSYFTELGFKEQIQMVNKDIDRLKKKR